MVRSDHMSIKELLQQVIQTPEQFFVRKLLGYNFRIEYKTGKSNLATDALSRVQGESEIILLASKPIPAFLDVLKEENQHLQDVREIHEKLDGGVALKYFSRSNGLLFYRKKYYLSLNSVLKDDLLNEFYKSKAAGHSGIKQTLVRLSFLFY